MIRQRTSNVILLRILVRESRLVSLRGQASIADTCTNSEKKPTLRLRSKGRHGRRTRERQEMVRVGRTKSDEFIALVEGHCGNEVHARQLEV